MEFVDARVSKVKRLTGGVVFVDMIPKNPVHPFIYYDNLIPMLIQIQSGKILRRQLRDRAAKELRSQTATVSTL